MAYDKAVILDGLAQIVEHFDRCEKSYPDLGFADYAQIVRDAISLLKEKD